MRSQRAWVAGRSQDRVTVVSSMNDLVNRGADASGAAEGSASTTARPVAASSCECPVIPGRGSCRTLHLRILDSDPSSPLAVGWATGC